MRLPPIWCQAHLHSPGFDVAGVTLPDGDPVGKALEILRDWNQWYFSLGPFPVSGSTGTVNKMGYGSDDFRVVSGASVRQITDFSEPDRMLTVIPGGQSGIPASPHYGDLAELWLTGRYHPIPLNREAIQGAHRLVLRPGAPAPGK